MVPAVGDQVRHDVTVRRAEAADAVVAAPAAALLLLLWRRVPVTTDAVTVDGSDAVVRELLAAPLTP